MGFFRLALRDDARTPCICLGDFDIFGMFRLRAGNFLRAKYLSGAALNMTSLRRHGEENVFSSG
jgi:hypothetical protein